MYSSTNHSTPPKITKFSWKRKENYQLVALWRCMVARVNLYTLLLEVPWCNSESPPVASTASINYGQMSVWNVQYPTSLVIVGVGKPLRSANHTTTNITLDGKPVHVASSVQSRHHGLFVSSESIQLVR
jgi:hypothetical protein